MKQKTVAYKIVDFLQKFLDFAVLVFLCLYIFTSVVFHDRLANVFGYEFNIVQSNSMKGTLNKFDFLVIVKEKSENIKVGDIVVFFDNSNKYKIIHRVTEIVLQNDETFYKTKGDNNDFPDSGYRTEKDIYAKFLLRIPYIGIMITFFSSQYGLLVILINIWNAVLIMLIWKISENSEKNFEANYKELREKWKK